MNAFLNSCICALMIIGSSQTLAMESTCISDDIQSFQEHNVSKPPAYHAVQFIRYCGIMLSDSPHMLEGDFCNVIAAYIRTHKIPVRALIMCCEVDHVYNQFKAFKDTVISGIMTYFMQEFQAQHITRENLVGVIAQTCMDGLFELWSKMGFMVLSPANFNKIFPDPLTYAKLHIWDYAKYNRLLSPLCVAACTNDLNQLINAETLTLSHYDHITGLTPLMHAVICGHVHAVEMLVNQASKSVDLQDAYGFTALMYAVINNRPQIVALLKRCGAMTDLVNCKQQTALKIAQKMKLDECIYLLQNAT